MTTNPETPNDTNEYHNTLVSTNSEPDVFVPEPTRAFPGGDS